MSLTEDTDDLTQSTGVSEIWFTRCPVPTATGIAADLGTLQEAFEVDGIRVSSLQDQPSGPYTSQHFEHGLATLFREGGNVPALWTRSRGQATRLLGLTWIDERQAIVVRPGSGIDGASSLAGRRLALPLRQGASVDFFRAMALHGFAGALASVELGLNNAELVDVEGSSNGTRSPQSRGNGWGPELAALVEGRVDAVYIKGAAAQEAAARSGAVIAVDLDTLEDRRFRVNNGTPRPITVHESLLDERPDLVVRFLSVLLDAAEWATSHPSELSSVLATETGSGLEGVSTAYRNNFHLSLHPDLSDERLALLEQQKDFLLAHGFLAGDVDVPSWAAPEPLAEAWASIKK